MNATRAARERMTLVRELPCVACSIQGISKVCGKTEAHHLNLDGKAGQARRGDEFVVPLGRWHHQGIPKDGMNSLEMAERFGPSLKTQSRRFRERIGSDELLLEVTNAMLRAYAKVRPAA